MITLRKLVDKLPVPTEWRLAWQRTLLDREYAKDIAEAKQRNDKEEIHTLELIYRCDIDSHDEEEDAYLTRQLLSKARKLHVTVPHRHSKDNSKSEYWYEGHNTGRQYLTARGVSALREEIRREVRARHESHAQWVVWLSALTGVIGAATGLVALLLQRS